MPKDYLDWAILGVGSLLLLTWLGILYSYIYKQQRHRKEQLIEATFAELVSNYLYGDPHESLNFLEIQRSFRKLKIYRDHPKNVQFLIDLMLRTQRSLSGVDAEKIKDLYGKIPPYRASYRKTLEKDPYRVAQGIREIYEMGQHQYLGHIAGYKDHPNLYVRREAQIGLVVFMGWDSLRFLPYLDREMELWQQIKIVEKLKHLYPEPELKYIHEASEIMNPSGRELLMRIIRKFRITEGVDFIISQLSHPVFYVREAAVRCLEPFQLDVRQRDRIKQQFPTLENLRLQKKVLQTITNAGPGDTPDFSCCCWDPQTSG